MSLTSKTAAVTEDWFRSRLLEFRQFSSQLYRPSSKVSSTTKRPRLKKPRESVYFYTFHRCASCLFADYVLKSTNHLRLVDYAGRIYNGELVDVRFEETGFIYGPIRLSTAHPSTIYSRLVEPVSRPEFIRDKTAVLLVRDPRDIIVSSYYSFGHTHGLSPLRQLENQQRELREKIRSETIDSYALQAGKHFRRYFEIADRVARLCKRGIVLKYEDMIENWEKFSSGLTRYFDLDAKVLEQIYERSRPLKKEDAGSHRRSGKPGAYRDKLRESTVASLNVVLAPVLTRFEYAV